LLKTSKPCGQGFEKIIQRIEPEQGIGGGFTEPGATICRVFLAGDYEEIPSATCVRFFHNNQELAGLAPQLADLARLPQMGYGSRVVWNQLHNNSDPFFAAYRTPQVLAPPETLTLQEAVEVAKDHVRACCDLHAWRFTG
jgi:hypothetical protein